jgi:hypothetical protein
MEAPTPKPEPKPHPRDPLPPAIPPHRPEPDHWPWQEPDPDAPWPEPDVTTPSARTIVPHPVVRGLAGVRNGGVAMPRGVPTCTTRGEVGFSPLPAIICAATQACLWYSLQQHNRASFLVD